MHQHWQRILAEDGVVIVDGGTGSELRRRGVDLSRVAWSGPASATHAELLRDIHLDYIEAGADIITTNTFGGTRFVLEAAGADFERVNAAAIWAAEEARRLGSRPVSIAGSISCLPPRFDPGAYPDRAAELAAYIELAEFLAANGADLIVLEMMQDTEHAALACQAACSVGLPFWLGLSCRRDSQDKLVGYDYAERSFTASLQALVRYEPDAINVMHTPPQAILPALQAMQAHWSGTIGAYPELTADTMPSDDEWVQAAQAWHARGARLLGGCCGTTPKHIAMLRALFPETESPDSIPMG